MFLENETLASAILGFLPDAGTTVTVGAITYNLDLTEDEVRLGLHMLVVARLAVQSRRDRYARTESAPRPVPSGPVALPT